MKIYRLKENATIPKFATQGSACFDVSAVLSDGEHIKAYNPLNKQVDVVAKSISGKIALQLYPDFRVLIPTGLIFDIPEEHVLKMFIRSSVASKKGLVLSNGTGIIDSDYVDECFILIRNVSDAVVTIEHGERLAQCILEPTKAYDLEVTETRPTQKTDRVGGFGSTGTK